MAHQPTEFELESEFTIEDDMMARKVKLQANNLQETVTTIMNGPSGDLVIELSVEQMRQLVTNLRNQLSAVDDLLRQ